MRKLTTLAAACLIALAGCGSSNDSDSHADHGGGHAESSAADGTTAEFNDADVMFAQMMIPHHEQAIEMADLVPDRTENADLLALATQIKDAQGPEIDQLTSWLDDWDQPTEAPGGADHGSHGMDGMMTDEQMAQLEASSGDQFDQLWLQLMIAHHEGAITMAQTEIDEGAFAPAIEMATTIISAQQAEIDTMNSLLGS